MQKSKILVVEDNELNMKLFTDVLSYCNFNVKAVTDGNKAISIIKQYLPNLILMDIQLGGVSGLELIKKIKKISGIAHIPIIAITAFAMRHDVEKIMQSGCESYITKPIAIDILISQIKQHLTQAHEVQT